MAMVVMTMMLMMVMSLVAKLEIDGNLAKVYKMWRHASKLNRCCAWSIIIHFHHHFIVALVVVIIIVVNHSKG